MGGIVQPAPIGLPFGRYRLIGQLGAGGMAVVYRAVVDGPRGFRRDVVIKRMLSEYAEDPQFINMMASEARLCALLRHPNIVQVSEFGEVDGEYYIAMELVDGSDLNGVMKRSRLAHVVPPMEAVCFIVSEIASALGYAHALHDEAGQPLQVVHRDISPSNVMVTPAGIVKLLDFGIAKAASHIREERTRTGTIKGKLSYMSPEQALGEPLDGRSDLFALGTVFYECLTSSRLFKGENDVETLQRICQQSVAPPSTYVPAIPPDLDAVVLKMLARAREDRFQTGEELVAVLRPIMARIGSDAHALARFLATVAPAARSTGPATIVDAAPLEQTHSSSLLMAVAVEKTPALRRPPIALMAAALAALALIAGLLLLRGPRQHAPAVTVPPATSAATAAAMTTTANPATAPNPTTANPATTTPAAATQATAEAAAPIVPPSAPRPTEATSASVELSVFGSVGAEVLIDGRVRGKIPLEETLPRHSGPHQLMIRRPGFVSVTRRFDSDEDATVRITLAPRRKPTAVAAKHRQFDPEVIDDPFSH